MKTVVVKNQAEWDALPGKFTEETAVHVYSDPKVPLTIKKTPKMAEVSITEQSLVDVGDSATIGYVRDSATIGYVGDSATIGYVRDSATIGYVRDSATIGYVRDSATIGYVRDSATIGKAHDNAMVRILGDGVKIEAFNAVVIVCQDCKPTIKRHGTGVTVVRTKKVLHTVKTFAEVYGDGTKLTLYKSVEADTLCDHYTGKIKYEGVVECPDFDPDPKRQCGGGLHLSPTPYDALRYHDGKVLECEVARKDIVVYANDITKVRCRKVKVIGEWKP